jgi:hypothetical protein
MEPHSVLNYVGRIEGVYRSGDKVFAKTFKIVKHWEEIYPIAKNDPSAIGLSIDAIVGVDLEKEGEIAEIYHIRSADLVSDPATTKGIFESYTGEKMTLEELKKDQKELVAQIVKETTESVTKIVTEKVTKEVTETLAKKEDEKPDSKKEEERQDVKHHDSELLEACSETEVVLSSKQLKIARKLEGEELKSYLEDIKESQNETDPLAGKKSTKKDFDVETIMVGV